jgi:hypothetical protein
MAGLKAVDVAAGVDPRRIDRRSGKLKRVSEKVRRAVDLLLSGACATQAAAAERVGLDHRHLSRMFRAPHVRDYIDDRTRSFLNDGKLVASARLLELVHAKSERVCFTASTHLLAVNGIAPPTDGRGLHININNNQICAGYVIDMTPWQPVREREEEALVGQDDAGPR